MQTNHREIEVWADVACPFAHVGLLCFQAERAALGADLPRLRVRAWPLELVNDAAHSGEHLAPEIDALRAEAAPGLFAGFDAASFPASTSSTLAAANAAYRAGVEAGETFSFMVRDALWEHGRDVSAGPVLEALAVDLGVPTATEADVEAVAADHERGRARGVKGSPHFFTADDDFFCPSLDIQTDSGEMVVSFDRTALAEFVATVFG